MAQDLLNQYAASVTLSEDLHLRTRNDVLNLYTKGGFLLGAINEVHGPPAIGKTLMCAESIAECQAQYPESWQIIFDREGRLKGERLATVGVDIKSKRLIYVGNDPIQLTVENVYKLAQGLTSRIRDKDMAKVIDGLTAKGKGKKKTKPCPKLQARYQARLGLEGKPKAETIIRGLKATFKKKSLLKSHLLCPEDRSVIWIVLDSTTSMPSQTEVTGNKPGTDDVDLLEIIAREGDDSSNALGQRARSWSDFFRMASFVDSHTGMLATAQMRIAGIGSGRVYQKAAQPSANDYYGRNRFKLVPFPGYEMGGVFRDPKTGGLVFDADQIPAADRRATIGRRIYIDAKKTSGAKLSTFRCPHMYLGATGSDRAHSIWEFLHDVGLIKHHHQGKYIVSDDPEVVSAFTRADFVTKLYVSELELWSGLVKQYIEEVSNCAT